MANNKQPKTIGEAVQRLKLFNEKAKTLHGRKFIPQVSNNGFTWSVSPDAVTYETHGPDEESRLAVVSTLRMFVQPRDGISIPQIAELYEALPIDVDPKAKESARKAADGLKAYFDQPTGIVFQQDVVTNRRLFEVFMYGDLAHANDDKRADYEKWMKHPGASPILPVFFDEIVGVLLRGIFSFHAMNERTIQQLESFPPNQTA
jgi:hypothetical protein